MDPFSTFNKVMDTDPTPLTYPEDDFLVDLMPQTELSGVQWIPTYPTHVLTAGTHQYMYPGFFHGIAPSSLAVGIGSNEDLGLSQLSAVTGHLVTAPTSTWQHFEPDPWMAVDSFPTRGPYPYKGLEVLGTIEAAVDMPKDLPSKGPANATTSTQSAEVISQGADPDEQIQFRHVLPARIKSKDRRGVYSPDVWESHRSTIKQLYLDEDKPLKDVMQTMKQLHNFKASTQMYKARFRQWGFEKNSTEKNMSRLLLLKFQRDMAGKPSQFFRRSKEVDIQKYLRRKGVTEYDLIDFETQAELPMIVRCRTPPTLEITKYMMSPETTRYQELLLHHVRNALLYSSEGKQEKQAAALRQKFGADWQRPHNNPIGMLVGVTDYYDNNGPTESGMLIRRLAFRAVQHWASEGSTALMLAFLLESHHISNPELTLSLWKFVAAVSAQSRHYNPQAPLYEFLYCILHKNGISGLHALLESSWLQLGEEAEKAFGMNYHVISDIWRSLRHKFEAKATQRLEIMIENIRYACETGANSWGAEPKIVIPLMLLRCKLLRSINSSSDDAIEALGQLQSAITKCQDLTSKDRGFLLAECAYELHRTHLRRGWNDPAVCNPRIELAAYYLEEAIKYSLELFDNDSSEVIDSLYYLEHLYEEMGWQEKATEISKWRKQSEATIYTSLELEGAV